MKFKGEYLTIGLITISIILVVILVSGCVKVPIEKGNVTITTNKFGYEKGENITITIKNNFDKDVFISTFHLIQKFEDNEWRVIDKLGLKCLCGVMCKLQKCEALRKNETIDIEWNQTIEVCSSINEPESIIKNAEPGKYRIKSFYWPDINYCPQKNETIIYSNEFTIGCKEFEQQVHTLLEQANYCEVDSDCIISTEFGCPFAPCYSLVNKNVDLANIRESIDKHSKNCFMCEYECLTIPKSNEVKCVDNKCVKQTPEIRYLTETQYFEYIKEKGINVGIEKYCNSKYPGYQWGNCSTDEQCAVCPNCEECSAIGCHSIEFCEKMGFEKDWYENLYTEETCLQFPKICPEECAVCPYPKYKSYMECHSKESCKEAGGDWRKRK